MRHVYNSLPNPKPTVYFNRPQEKTCALERPWANGNGVGCDQYDHYTQNIPVKQLKEGDELALGNFRFDIYAASFSGSMDHNDESIVMMMTHKPSGHTMLHTGDANKRVGRYLVDNYNLKTDVLGLPHHGCKGQPDDDLYYEANPHIAVWQTTIRAQNERLDICGHTINMMKKIGVPIQLWQWKLPNERIDFPIKGVPKRSSIMPIIMMLLLDD